MARYHPSRDLQPLFDAVEYWRDTALLSGGSVFVDDDVWSDSNLVLLNRFYVENLDLGEGNFMQKLEGQLEQSPQSVKLLAAEMLWFMLLSPSNISPEKKRETVGAVWAWAKDIREPSPRWLTDEVLFGVGSAGTAFNTLRWRELVFFVRFMLAFRALSESRQAELVADGWQFAEWLEDVEESDVRQLRHMMLYLLFPDQFDRIFGRSDRRKLLSAMTTMPLPQINRLSALEMSREIQKIRSQREQQLETRELDFYESPLRDEWKVETDGQDAIEAVKTRDPFLEACAGIDRSHVLSALTQIDEDGVAPEARSTTYDLIYGSDRYPPKYVLSLAAEEANGEPLARNTFTGGADSPAFKVLANLGFHIELKDFLQDLVGRFVAQADEAKSLVVRDYPKEYRGLTVKVSFGQGVLARIPWISFTGYEHTTSNGVYPVLLYFKSCSRLVVARGVSETNKPAESWQQDSNMQTVADYFSSEELEPPHRYGRSFLHKSFELPDALDLQAVGEALEEVIGSYHQQFRDEIAVEPVDIAVEHYDLAEALDGLFIEEAKFEEILATARHKQNVILQGPPGVGKTFACKRLAYALIEEEAPDRLGMVQFHQSYSYEDFIQGYRPSGEGFQLKNGVFYQFCQRAKEDPANTYVFIIDEINRGNLSKIFGELMLLVEADKRGPEWAIPLTYSPSIEEKFYIPENVYLIGLMNTADRSLALVDYALRRRFGFADLEPGFDTDEYRQYMVDKGAKADFVEDLIQKLGELNQQITDDTANLGRGYCIGHSFFTAIPDGVAPDWTWFKQVVRTEIGPLLREYYFDDESKAYTLIEELERRPE